jgi:hypothetical protein
MRLTGNVSEAKSAARKTVQIDIKLTATNYSALRFAGNF